MSEVVPALRETGLAGRPPKHARAFLERQRPILAARWVRACRRAIRYLNNEANPIDATWVRLFSDVADRVGLPRRTEQAVDAISATFSASVHTERTDVTGRLVSNEEALLFLESRVASLRAVGTAVALEREP